jgi:hypothetical protein
MYMYFHNKEREKGHPKLSDDWKKEGIRCM